MTETCRKFGEKICCAGSVTSDAAKQSQVRRYKEAAEFLLKSLPHVQRHVSMSDSCRYNRVDKKVKKGSPYSITEHRVLELIPVLGSQPACDVSHKPGGRLPLLSARPAVTPATLKRAATNLQCK